MDWGRAKSVLIFAFLMLNIVLGYQLWLDLRERLNMNVDLTNLPPEINSIMQERNIRLQAKLPAETPELQDLTYRFTIDRGTAELQKLDQPVDSRIIFFSKKELLDGLGDVIPSLEEYEFDPAMSTDRVFVLYRMVEGLPMFDVTLELYSSNQKIYAYKQYLAEQIQPGQNKEQSVLSASKAVGNLIERNLQPDAVIKEIRLGYKGQLFDSKSQVSAPSWRVVLEDREIYIDAISGEVVTEESDTALSVEEGE
ncbi:hypothetical protein EBB07_05515 [Paenibacillaceae bacterium]|nr:hypothetical protein EBB07_05515 [Paenibacillaceae bacterium]